MTRRRWIAGLLLLALVVAGLGGLESQHIVSGWLRGEAFYRGRPTSYWRAEMERWGLNHFWFGGDYRGLTSPYLIRPPLMTRLPYLNRLFPAPVDPPLTGRDPAARPVLTALVNDPNVTVHFIAKLGLRNLDERKESD